MWLQIKKLNYKDSNKKEGWDFLELLLLLLLLARQVMALMMGMNHKRVFCLRSNQDFANDANWKYRLHLSSLSVKRKLFAVHFLWPIVEETNRKKQSHNDMILYKYIFVLKLQPNAFRCFLARFYSYRSLRLPL